MSGLDPVPVAGAGPALETGSPSRAGQMVHKERHDQMRVSERPSGSAGEAHGVGTGVGVGGGDPPGDGQGDRQGHWEVCPDGLRRVGEEEPGDSVRMKA